jgi:hypothetical protein
MRGGSPKSIGEVASGLRAPGTPTPGLGAQPRELQPVPAPRGYGGEGATPEQKERLGEKLAHWVNTWADSKHAPVVDELIAEARKVGWLR